MNSINRRRIGRYLLMACVVLCFHGPGYAQQTPGEIADEQLATYRLTISKACKNGERKRAGSEEKVQSYCACLMQALDKDMTRDEWRQALFHEMNKQYAQTLEILGRHLQGNARACRT